jgi:anti-sigma B factor antagonist
VLQPKHVEIIDQVWCEFRCKATNCSIFAGAKMTVSFDMVKEIQIIVVEYKSLDASKVEDFIKLVSEEISKNKKNLIDLSKVDFVDSAGLGSLLSCLKKAKSAGGELKIFGLTRSVRSLFELMRMQKIFSIYDDRSMAIASFD